MSKNKRNTILPYWGAGVIALLIISVLFFVPSLFRNDATFTSLEFIVEERIEHEDSLILRGRFDKELEKNETLWFYVENAKLEIHIHNKSMIYNEGENAPSFFRSPGSTWCSLKSDGIKTNETVEIIIQSFYEKHSQAADKLLLNIHMGDGLGLFKLMVSHLNFFDTVIIIAMIAGLIFLGEGAIDIAHGILEEGVRIALFGFYCLSGGLWCVTDIFYPYLSLIITPPWLTSIIDMLGLLLFPIALAFLIRYYIRGKRTRSIMSIIVWIEILLGIVCLLLQFIGAADLSQQQFLIGIVALPSIGVAMICIVMELKIYKDNYLLLLFLTVLPVFISNLIDGANILYAFMNRRTLMCYSFAISALLLIFQLVSYAKAEVTKKQTMCRLEKEITNAQISIMMSQIQPHFLYNSLQGIKLLCSTNPSKAYEALDHFAYYLRGNLDSLNHVQLIPFEKELVHIRDYLYLEKMRFGKKLKIVWEISFQEFMIPPLTVQPLMENAVRHGVNKKKHGGTVTIRTQKASDSVVIIIADDGVGFDPATKPEDGRSHIGIENTRNRLSTMCGGILTIESEKGVGTVAKVILKI